MITSFISLYHDGVSKGLKGQSPTAPTLNEKILFMIIIRWNETKFGYRMFIDPGKVNE